MDIKSYDYDLKNEIEEYKVCGDDNLYKFLLYKSTAKEKKFDCDRCDYIKYVYSKLWRFDYKCQDSFQYVSVGGRHILMGMDTMNSFWTTFAWSLNKWCKEDINNAFGITYVTTDSAKVLITKYNLLEKIIEKNLSKDILDKFIVFSKLTHTIGNMVLVPKKIEPYTNGRQTFNTARASKWNDYFDLSLIWLKNNKEPMWDKNTFEKYIKMFALEGYVEENFNIKPITKTHHDILLGANIDSRPQSKQELEKWLDNTNELIVQRGKILYQRLINNIDIADEITLVESKPNEINDEKGIKQEDKMTRKSKIKAIWIAITNFIFNVVWMGSIPFVIIASFTFFLIGSLSLERFSVKQIIFIASSMIIFEGSCVILVALLFATRRYKIYIRAKDNYNQVGSYCIKKMSKTHSWMVIVLTLFTIFILMILFLSTILFWGLMDNLIITLVVDYICFVTLVIPYGIIWFYFGMKNRCRSCKIVNTLKTDKLEIISEEDITLKVNDKIVNYERDLWTGREREVIVYSERYVPGIQVLYKQNYICKWCGKKHYAKYFTNRIK